MSETTTYRLHKVCRELQVGIDTAVDFLSDAGFDIPSDPNSKISETAYMELKKEFNPDVLGDLMKRTQEAVQHEDYHTASKLMKEIKQYKTGDL